jgi:oxalate---CoA ligase
MNPEYRKPDGTSRAHLLPIDSELIGTAAFARARVRWGGQEWGSDELSHALDAETCLSSLAGMRVATLIESQFLSGLATLSLIERGAQCVPLNAAWRESEVRDVLTTLDVQVVIVERADCLASLLQQLPVSVHLLELNGKAPASRVIKECEHGSEHPDTEGLLILLSSGSTGKPKAIPLDQQQLQEAADEIIRSLDLDESDACLNFLPMMHIGGFLDQFLVPLRSGGKVVFADPHRPELALPLAKEERVTWIQGAPAMLNNLLRAGSEPSLPDLRFVRSVSAPLSREMLGRVENRFGAPVIEMYGMSETAGLITSNPLPPRPRKLGSVGVATDIAIQVRSSESIAENPGHGEIWVSGSRVIREYLADRGDTGVWEGEWFRTGDLGHMDEDGYLFLTGRLGDLINRGGQKFSPVELDEFCSAWPEASEAAAYGFAHPSLGQEVGLALVLAGEELDKQTVQERIAQELAPYKLPRRILFLDALPRNQNGKLQRHLLASMQAGARVPVLECSNESPTELESRLLDLWMQNLSVDELGIDDDYFESGGDSLSATTLLATLEKELGAGVAAVDFFECATVRKLAGYLEANPQNTAHTSD